MERDSNSATPLMGWLLAILAVVFGALVAHRFALAERWFGLTLFGVVLPGSALAGWAFLRQRSVEAQRTADQMFILFQVAMMSILVILDNSQKREQELQAECIQQIEAAIESQKETGSE